MFTQLGFLGTKALLYMDIVTLYFALLPFLLFFSIRLAIQKKYKKHFIAQSMILSITVVMVLIFEIGVRLTGGFTQYVKSSSISYDFLVIFLILHIIVAICSLAGWFYQVIRSYKSYKATATITDVPNHKKVGKILFLALTLNSIMGVSIYFFLFVM